jgi:hypothetical protein
MQTIAIGRFANQDITAIDGLRIPQDGLLSTTQIPGVNDTVNLPLILQLQFGDGRTKNVARVVKPESYTVGDIDPSMKVHGLK